MAMKTACCGKSLRSVTLILLYFNLIGAAWGLLSGLTSVGDNSYGKFVEENSNSILNTVIDALGTLIFLMTIVSICQEKPSVPLLTATVVFLLVEVFSSIITIIRLNSGHDVKKLYNMVIEEKAEEKASEVEREKYKKMMKDAYPAVMFFVFVVLVVVLAFKLYSAMVFYSYKVDLRARPVYNVPARQNADDKEFNASAPAGYVQYATTPGQPITYYSQTGPVQYPGMILQYPGQPQPYPGQLPPYPSQPPQYPSQPPVYPCQPPEFPSQPSLYPSQLPQCTQEPK